MAQSRRNQRALEKEMFERPKAPPKPKPKPAKAPRIEREPAPKPAFIPPSYTVVAVHDSKLNRVDVFLHNNGKYAAEKSHFYANKDADLMPQITAFVAEFAEAVNVSVPVMTKVRSGRWLFSPAS